MEGRRDGVPRRSHENPLESRWRNAQREIRRFLDQAKYHAGRKQGKKTEGRPVWSKPRREKKTEGGSHFVGGEIT